MPSPSPHGRNGGLFITFEGGEGCGKSTQVGLLKAYLEQDGYTVTATRDPGGCKRSALLRRLLVEQSMGDWDEMTETLLFMAARNELLQNIIRPALSNGTCVLSDRFIDSNMVYQTCGRNVPDKVLDTLADLVVGPTMPDLTIVLDMPVSEGLGRAMARPDSIHESRFENLDMDFHERVRRGFLRIAERNPKRCIVIDARGTPDEVHARIVEAVAQHLRKNA